MLVIPDSMKVGFQKRTDALTDKLGFIIPRENKGWKQSVAWERWRDSSIEPIILENTPKNGYVINKSLKHHPFSSFGQVRTKVRIHSPEGFEFEITTENLIEILEVADISKKYIDSECVLAWFGREIWLLPIETEVYKKYAKELEAKALLKAQKEAEALEKNKLVNKIKVVKKAKTEKEIINDNKRKEIKKNLEVGDVFKLNGATGPKDGNYIYLGKKTLITENDLNGVVYENVQNGTFEKDLKEVPVFLYVNELKMKDLLLGNVNNVYHWHKMFLFNDKSIDYLSKKVVFDKKAAKQLQEVWDDKLNITNKKIIFTKENNTYMYRRSFDSSFMNGFKKIAEKMLKQLASSEKELKARTLFLVKKDNNIKNNGYVELEFEGVKLLKNKYGSLEFKMIVRAYSPLTQEFLGQTEITVSERDLKDFNGLYNSFKKLKTNFKDVINLENLDIEAQTSCIVSSFGQNSKMKDNKSLNFKITWS